MPETERATFQRQYMQQPHDKRVRRDQKVERQGKTQGQLLQNQEEESGNWNNVQVWGGTEGI